MYIVMWECYENTRIDVFVPCGQWAQTSRALVLFSVRGSSNKYLASRFNNNQWSNRIRFKCGNVIVNRKIKNAIRNIEIMLRPIIAAVLAPSLFCLQFCRYVLKVNVLTRWQGWLRGVGETKTRKLNVTFELLFTAQHRHQYLTKKIIKTYSVQ